VQDLELELPELELVAVQQVAVRGAQELFGVGGVDAGLAAGRRFDVVLAATWPGCPCVARMYLIVSPAACSTIFSAGSPGSMTTASFVVAHDTM